MEDSKRILEILPVEIVSAVEKLPIGLSWNSAVKCAETDWVHLLHDDDWLDTRAYENFFNDSEVGTAGLWLGSSCDHYETGDRSSMIPTGNELLIRPREIAELICRKQLTRCVSVLINKDKFESCGGFSLHLRHCVDWEAFLRIGLESGVKLHPALFGHYRVHQNSLTGWDGGQKRFRYVDNGALAQDVCRIIDDRFLYGESWGVVKMMLKDFVNGGLRYSCRRFQTENVLSFLRSKIRLTFVEA
jgi:hypothetical protein